MTLPLGWDTESLGNICSLLTDGTHHSPSNSASGEFPYITAKNVKWHGLDLRDLTYVSGEEHAAIYRRCPVLAGDVLLIKDGATTGVATINDLDEPFSMLSSVALLRPITDLLDNRFLWRWLKSESAQSAMLGAMSGSAIRRLTLTKISQTDVPIPPLAEQRRIVAKLDALIARLARARAELDRVPVLAQQMRNAILVEVFSAGASTERIDALCMVGTGSTPKRGEARYYVGGTIPWVTSGVVNQRSVHEPTEYVTETAIKETNCKVFPAGSLLVALYGEGKTRGKVTSLGIAAATNQALAVLHTFDTDRVEPAWIRRFLESRYEMTRSEAAGGVQPNLNLGIVKAIAVPLPPIAEQRQALTAIDNAFARADRLEAEATRARALLDRLESALLAKAFRGELVPQDSSDEPAQVLLDRIRQQRTAAPKAKRGRKAKALA